MAVVGEAHIIVRAITNQVERDIKRGFEGLSDAGDKAGDNLGKSFRKSLDKQMSASGPGKLADALRGLVPDAEGVYLQFRRLTRIGFAVQAGFGAIVGSIGAIVGGLGALIGVAGGAAAALVAVGGAAASIGATFGLAKFALGGIGEALRAGGGGGGRGNEAAIEAARRRLADATDAVTSAQEKLNRALAEGREELQQIGFAAEEAALQEQAAAIELEKARDSLARVQDLAPSSLARREAELAFAEAELGYRRSKDAAEDLGKEQERLAKTGVNGLDSVAQARADLADAEEDRLEAEKALADAINNTNRALSGAASAYSKLTKSQREFADYLKEVKPLFKGLREEVASGFLPVLQTQIQRFISAGLVQVLSRGFSEVGVALGEASELFTDAFLESRGLDNLASFFSSTAEVAPIFGKVLGQTFGNFLTILQAAEPITRRFIEFLEAKSSTFTNFLNTGSASGELTEFFNRAGDLAARFGDVFGNIFGFLGDIIMANFGPGTGGDMLLTWLQDVTQGFNDIDPAFLEKYFKGASENAIALLDSFGILFELIIKAGDDPGVKGFYDNLNQGASALETIITESVAAAPSLGEFLALMAEVIAIFADSGSVQAFFDVLNTALGLAVDFLTFIKPIIDFAGPIFAAVTAFTLVGSTLLTVGKIFGGFFIVVLGQLATLTGAGGAFNTAMAKLGPTASKSSKLIAAGNVVATASQKLFNLALKANPIGIIITAVAALVAGLVYFFTQTETGKAAWAAFTEALAGFWNNTIKPTLGAIGDFFKNIYEGFILPVFEGMQLFLGIVAGLFVMLWEGAIQPALIAIGDAFVFLYEVLIKPIIDGWIIIFQALGNMFTFVYENLIQPALQALGDMFTSLWETTISPVINLIVDAFQFMAEVLAPIFQVIGDAFTAVWDGITQFFENTVNGIIILFEGMINFIIKGLNWLVEQINKISVDIPDSPIFGKSAGTTFGFNFPKIPDVVLGRVEFAKGGLVLGSGTDTSDSIPALLSNGEYVINAKATSIFRPLLDAINYGRPVSSSIVSGVANTQAQAMGAGASINITVNPSPGMDERELATVVSRRLAYEMRKGTYRA